MKIHLLYFSRSFRNATAVLLAAGSLIVSPSVRAQSQKSSFGWLPPQDSKEGLVFTDRNDYNETFYTPTSEEGKRIAAWIRQYITTFNAKVDDSAIKTLRAAQKGNVKVPTRRQSEDTTRLEIARIENAMAASEQAKQYRLRLMRSQLAISIASRADRGIQGPDLSSPTTNPIFNALAEPLTRELSFAGGLVTTAARIFQSPSPTVYMDALVYMASEYYFVQESRDAILTLVNAIRGMLPPDAIRIYEPGAALAWNGARTGFLVMGAVAFVTYVKGARLAQLERAPGLNADDAAREGFAFFKAGKKPSLLGSGRIGSGIRGVFDSLKKWRPNPSRASRPNTIDEEKIVDQALARNPGHELRPGSQADEAVDITTLRFRNLELDEPTPSQARAAADSLEDGVKKAQREAEDVIKQGGATTNGVKSRPLAIWGRKMIRGVTKMAAYQGLGQALYRGLYGYSLHSNEHHKLDPMILFDVVKGQALWDLADRNAHLYRAIRLRYSRFFDSYERPSLGSIARVNANPSFWKEVDLDIARVEKLRHEFEHFRQFATEYGQEREIFLNGEEIRRPDLSLYTAETKEQYRRAFSMLYARQTKLRERLENHAVQIREMRASSRDEAKATASLEEIRLGVTYMAETLRGLKQAQAALKAQNNNSDFDGLFAK